MKEATIQKYIVGYLDAALSPQAIVCHIPNGLGRLSYNQGRNAKAMGLLAGAADLLVIDRGLTVFLEVKNETGRQTARQKEFEVLCTAQSIGYYIVRSIDDAKHAIITEGLIDGN